MIGGAAMTVVNAMRQQPDHSAAYLLIGIIIGLVIAFVIVLFARK